MTALSSAEMSHMAATTYVPHPACFLISRPQQPISPADSHAAPCQCVTQCGGIHLQSRPTPVVRVGSSPDTGGSALERLWSGGRRNDPIHHARATAAEFRRPPTEPVINVPTHILLPARPAPPVRPDQKSTRPVTQSGGFRSSVARLP